MNITMVLGNDYLRPYVDGRVYREVRSLRNAGHNVTVVCWARTVTNEMLNHAPRSEELEGVRVLRAFAPIAPIGSPVALRVIQHLRAMRALSRLISSTPTDTLHCHDFNTLFVRFYLRGFGRPVVYDSHEDFINMIDEVLPSPLLWLARRAENYMLSHYVDVAITVCEPIKRSLERFGADNTVLVLNCRDLEDYSAVPQTAVTELRRKLVPGDELIALYIGSIGNDRGLKDLIEVFRTGSATANTTDAFGRLHLVLGGLGHLEKRLQSCIQDQPNITWVGFVPGKKLVEYDLASDIMLVLFNPARISQRVCLPNKLFEAMAAAKPIIVCSGTEAAKVVEQEHCGLIVPYGDRRALRDALTKLAGDRKLRTVLGRNGFNAAKRAYNWRVQEERLLKVYEELGNIEKR